MSMRWWGWGEDAQAPPLPPGADALIRDELGDGAPHPRPQLEDVRLPVPGLGAATRERLERAVGQARWDVAIGAVAAHARTPCDVAAELVASLELTAEA